MARVSFGEALKRLFTDHELGLISAYDFNARKRVLLDQSKCQFARLVPYTRTQFYLSGIAITATAMFAILYLA